MGCLQDWYPLHDLPSHHHYLQYSSSSSIILILSTSLSRLSKWLGTELSPTILLDFPSVLDLATELDHRHHRRCRQRRDQRRCDQRHPGHGRWWLRGWEGGSEVREVGGWQGVVDSGATERVEDARSTFLNTNPRKHWRKRYIVHGSDLLVLDIHGFLAKIHKKQSCSGKLKLPNLSAATCRFPMIRPSSLTISTFLRYRRSWKKSIPQRRIKGRSAAS